MHLNRNSFEKIRKILLKDWDPIGIEDCVDAQDEYDSYIPEIYNLVIGGEEDKFLNYMSYVEKYIGLDPISAKEHKELYHKLKKIFD
jgi:hypothetical protein